MKGKKILESWRERSEGMLGESKERRKSKNKKEEEISGHRRGENGDKDVIKGKKE